jgi:hypothetical protein
LIKRKREKKINRERERERERNHKKRKKEKRIGLNTVKKSMQQMPCHFFFIGLNLIQLSLYGGILLLCWVL